MRSGKCVRNLGKKRRGIKEIEEGEDKRYGENLKGGMRDKEKK